MERPHRPCPIIFSHPFQRKQKLCTRRPPDFQIFERLEKK